MPSSLLRLLLPATAFLWLPAIGIAGGGDSRDRTAEGPYHARSIVENVLTLPSLPDFRLEVAGEFTLLGSTSFSLSGRANADVIIFAEMDDDSIERLVKVQVESLVDDAANDYSWDGPDTLRVADAEYVRGFWCFDAAEVARESPTSDTAKTQEWLQSRGYHQVGVFVGTRLARVFADGRSELLLFYGETAMLTGVDCNDEEAAMNHLPSIVRRSDGAFVLAE